MWIRSQDKTELINTNRVQVEKNNIYAFTDTTVEDCNYVLVGTYETRERAIEVLDKIQDDITDFQPSSECQFQIVFEMPEE